MARNRFSHVDILSLTNAINALRRDFAGSTREEMVARISEHAGVAPLDWKRLRPLVQAAGIDLKSMRYDTSYRERLEKKSCEEDVTDEERALLETVTATLLRIDGRFADIQRRLNAVEDGLRELKGMWQ